MSSIAAAPHRAARRVPLWDNARWVAIALVVVGHGILPLIAESDAAYGAYLFIYAFHMPVFVMVSGYFAKSGPPGPRQLKRVLTDIVFPYVIFEAVWTLIDWAVGGELNLDFATASWTLWFLIALAIWRIVLPYLVLLRFPLTISVIVSIATGYVGSIDSTLALSRTLGLLPFFVFGWALRQRQLTGRWLALPQRVIWRWRAAAIALFAALAVFIGLNIGWLRDALVRRFLLYDEDYPSFGYETWWAGLVRLGLMAAAVVLVIAFLMLMPRRRTPITELGAATMYIYLLHTFFLYPWRETGVLAGPQPWWALPLMVLYCLAVAVLLSQRFVRRVFRPVVEPRAAWLFRREPQTATGTLVLPPDPR